MKILLPLDEYLRRQREEMLSPFHRWVTGEKVGHDPTHNELAEYYVRSGAARDSSDKYEIHVPCQHSESFVVAFGVADLLHQ